MNKPVKKQLSHIGCLNNSFIYSQVNSLIKLIVLKQTIFVVVNFNEKVMMIRNKLINKKLKVTDDDAKTKF